METWPTTPQDTRTGLALVFQLNKREERGGGPSKNNFMSLFGRISVSFEQVAERSWADVLASVVDVGTRQVCSYTMERPVVLRGY